MPRAQYGQFGICAATPWLTEMPHGSVVGVPICSVRKQPQRPTASPSATAGANRSPVCPRYPNRRFVTTAPNDRIAIRDTTTGEVRATFYPPQVRNRQLGVVIVKAISFSRDGKQLMWVWYTQSHPDFTPPTTLIQTTQVKVVEWASGAEIASFERFGYWERAAFSPDSRSVALGVVICDVLTGEELSRLNEKVYYHDFLTFLPDSQGLVTASGGSIFRLSNVAGTQPPQTIELKLRTSALALSADGRWVAGSGFALDKKAASTKVWDLLSGRESIALPAQQSVATALAFRPDGSWLALGCSDGTITVWDLKAGSPALVLRGHTAKVRCLAFSADGCRLASAGDDNTLRIWDTQPPD